MVGILGPRQCGKTTLARDYLAARTEPQIHYFDLEDPDHLNRLADPKLALEGLEGLIVIDEIQRSPELFPLLRVLIDRRPRRQRYLILGSASRALIRQSSETLAGRIAYLELPLFSVNYFCRLAPTIFAGSGRRESRSTTMTPVGRVGVACDVQSGVENALPRRCTVAPLLARVFHAAGAVHRLLGFRSIPAFRRSTVGGRGAAADPEHVPGEQAPRGISGGTGPCGSSGRRTQACSA